MTVGDVGDVGEVGAVRDKGDKTVVVVVGGGVLGTTHALWAIEHDFLVVHLEREPAAQWGEREKFRPGLGGGAGRRPELELAVRSHALWEALARGIPEVGFRPAGSLTLATSEPELSLVKEAVQRDDALARQWDLLDGTGARELNPELSSEVAGGLYCRADGIVEPREAVPAIQRYLSRQPGYTWVPGRAVVELARGACATTAAPGTEEIGSSRAPGPLTPA